MGVIMVIDSDEPTFGLVAFLGTAVSVCEVKAKKNQNLRGATRLGAMTFASHRARNQRGADRRAEC